jgi:hypothetical protein
MARAATVKAKREALEHLRAIKRDVEAKNSVLEGQLEEKKREARDIQARGVETKVGERLGGIQKIAYAWEKQGRNTR